LGKRACELVRRRKKGERAQGKSEGPDSKKTTDDGGKKGKAPADEPPRSASA